MRLAIVTCLIFLATNAWGKMLRTPYQGVRPLGMGNAFIALADDSNLLWYNPAGLARVKGGHFNLLDVQLGVDSMDTFDRLGKFIFKGDAKNLLRPDTEAIRVGVKPTFMMPYFGFSFFDNLNSFTDIRNMTSLDASVDLNLSNDVGLIVGLGIPATKYLSFGFSVRGFQRNAVDSYLTARDLLEEIQTSQGEFMTAIYDHINDLVGFGYAIGLNAGVLVEVPLPKDFPAWTFAGTVEDLGQTTFKAIGSLPTPNPIRPTYHLGTALSYTIDSMSKFNIALDYRNATEFLPWHKKLHLGVEYRHKFFALRAGAYDAYLSWGFSLEFPPHTRLHFATYQVELDDLKRQERGQRYYMMQFIIGFNPF